MTAALGDRSVTQHVDDIGVTEHAKAVRDQQSGGYAVERVDLLVQGLLRFPEQL
jgi:hypothetical protein